MRVDKHHDRLEVNDESGAILSAERLAEGGVRVYCAGLSLTREQARALRDWLDEGALREEVQHVREELAGVRGSVRLLVDSLRDAWWVEAAEARRRLTDWLES